MLPPLPGAVLDHQGRTSLDRAARLLGLSLDAREDLASDGPRARDFVAAVAEGDLAAAARMAGLDAPPNLLLRLGAVPPSPRRMLAHA